MILTNSDFKYLEHMVNIPEITRKATWFRDKECNYKMIQVYKDILNEYDIKQTDKNDWMIYIPCSYNNSEKQIKKISSNLEDQRIFIVNNTDQISSKSNLWKNLVSKYGLDYTTKIAPNSYIIEDDGDLNRFLKDFSKDKIYIMKKNIQRQEGIKITNDKDEILNSYKNKYVIVQELLQDPYLINGRKTNMRFYVLLVCQNNELSIYVHSEGFIYYTKSPFKRNTLNWSNNITTGYIERWIYKVNPLTHSDFKNYLDNYDRPLLEAEKMLIENNKKISETVFNRIYNLIVMVVKALDHKLCVGSHLEKNITFQLFGFDIAVDDKLYPKIIEVNVGPNLKLHDERDSEVKHAVIRDLFKVLKIVPDENNKYIKLL